MRVGLVALWVASSLTLEQADRAVARQARGDLRDVVSLLQQMLERFAQQSAADQQAWDQYAAWSDQGQQDKQAFLQEQQSVASVNSAQEHASAAIVQSLDEALTLLKSEISETVTSVSQLQKMRSDEHLEYEKQVADLGKTTDAVNRGIDILEGHYGAAGLAQLKPTLTRAVQLAALHLADDVSQDQLSLLTKVAQNPDYLSEENKGRDYSGDHRQGGASTVMATLTKIRDGMLDAKRGAVAKENEARRQYEEAKEAKDTDLQRSREEFAVKTDQIAEDKATGEMAHAAVVQATLDINEAQTALSTLSQEQKHFQEIYGQRVRTRGSEVSATQAAVDALRSVSALQTTASTRRLLLQVGPPALVKAARSLQTLGDKDHSAILLEAATAVQQLRVGAHGKGFNPEATDPVKDLLRQLITRLQDEASAETSHKEWCDTEKASAAAGKVDRESSIASLTAEVPRLATSIQMLGREIEFAKATLDRVSDENAAASAVRATNNEEYTRAREDHIEVIRALDGALQALGTVQFSLLEVGSTRTKQSPFASVTSAPSATSALQLLQELRNQYASAKTDLETEETQQLATFQQLKESNEVFRRATDQTLRAKEAERRQKGVRQTEAAQELVGAKGDLAQVTKYIADLRPSCDDIRMTFEERKHRREGEIDALQAALSALQSAA